MRIYVWVILIGTQFLHDLIKRRQDLRFRYPVKEAAVPMLNVVNEPTLARSVNVSVSEESLRNVTSLFPKLLSSPTFDRSHSGCQEYQPDWYEN